MLNTDHYNEGRHFRHIGSVEVKRTPSSNQGHRRDKKNHKSDSVFHQEYRQKIEKILIPKKYEEQILWQACVFRWCL
jgi:hypothetical protein